MYSAVHKETGQTMVPVCASDVMGFCGGMMTFIYMYTDVLNIIIFITRICMCVHMYAINHPSTRNQKSVPGQ